MSRWLFLFVSLSAVVSAQSNSVNVTGSVSGNVQPDQLVYGITVQSGLDVSLDDVTAALTAAGVTGAGWSGVSSTIQYSSKGQALGPVLNWNFTLAAAIGASKSTAATLAAAQAALSKANLTMTFGAQGVQVSPQAQASQPCPASDLLANARAQAQKLAAAAGSTLGGVTAISGYSNATADAPQGVFATSTYLPSCQAGFRFALGTLVPSDSDSVSIVATRSTTLQPDLISVAVYVNAASSVSIDDVLAALRSVGATTGTLLLVSTSLSGGGQPAVSQWTFSLPVPIANLKAILAALVQLQQNAGSSSPMTFGFTVQGTQVSQQLLAAQTCSYSALLTDAQSAAQKLASAAGVSVGPVVSLSQGPGTPIAVSAYRQGDFSQIVDPTTGIVGGFSSFLLGTPAPTTNTCSMSVQFKLIH